MNNKLIYGITAAICIFLIIGCVLIYGVHYDYNADASLNEDGSVDYTLTSSLSTYCACVVMSDLDFKSNTYLYLDADYKSFYPASTQKTFMKTLKDVFEKRNYLNVKYVNSKELKDVLTTSVAIDSMIIFASGTLPDTVYTENGPELLKDWLNKGGSIYWAGPNIGSKMSTHDDIIDTKYGLLTGLVSDEKSSQTVKYASEFSMKMYYSFKDCTYGLKKNCADSLVLGYTSDDYSSASVMKYSNGRIFILGGDVTGVKDDMMRTCTAIAGTILSGVTENTKILASHEFHKETGSMSGHVDCHAKHGDIIYFMFGVPYSTWSKAIVL